MSERNPDSEARVTSCCACGRTKLVYVTPLEMPVPLCLRCGTETTRRTLTVKRARGRALGRDCAWCGEPLHARFYAEPSKCCSDACRIKHLHATRLVPSGPKHFRWKGDEAGVQAIHSWARKHWPKRGFCEACGAEAQTDWANVDHTYRRVRSDWFELCRPCHGARDSALGLRRWKKKRQAAVTP